MLKMLALIANAANASTRDEIIRSRPPCKIFATQIDACASAQKWMAVIRVARAT
jgi:hypothetical protein